MIVMQTFAWLLALLFMAPLAAFTEPLAYVMNSQEGTVSVIDTATNTVSTIIPVGTDPHMIAFTPDGARAYITDASDGAVFVIATATNAVVATIPGNRQSRHVAITPDGLSAYVSGGDDIAVIDTQTNTVIDTISGVATQIAITPDGSRAYATADLNGDILVLVIDTTTNSVLTTIPVGGAPIGIAITPDGTKVFVAGGSDSDTVAVIDADTNTIIATIPLEGNLYAVAITPDGSRAYVADSRESGLWVIDAASNTVITNISDVFPTDVTITPDGAKAYATDALGDTVSVIDTATHTVTATIPIIRPYGIAIAPPISDSSPVPDVSAGPDSDSSPIPDGLADADLAAIITKFKAKRRKAGDHKVTVKLQVRNDGTGIAGGPFSISLFLSDDAVFDANDELLDTRIMTEDLLPGETSDVIKLKRKGLPPVTGFAVVVIDDDNIVAESEERNNILVQATGIQELETVDQVIPAIEGGMVSLPSGSRVTIPPGTFATDQTVTLSLFSALPDQPPSGIIIGIGPTLMLSFTPQGTPNTINRPSHSVRQQTTPAPGDLQFDLDLGAHTIPGIDGSAPIANIVDLSEGNTFVGIPGSVTNNTATYTVPLSLLQNSQRIAVSQANLNPTLLAFRPPDRFGTRIWNPALSQWLDFPQNFDPNKKTLVLVHGILSTVEGAFGNCVNDILAEGGYEQVLGFNYDWTEGVFLQSGPRLATFLNDLERMMVTDVDMVAHSMGGIVAIAAASETDLQIQNMVLEGAPLAGTPLSSIANRNIAWVSTLANIHRPEDDPPPLPLTLEDVTNSGVAADLEPENPLLVRIQEAARAKHPETNFIKVVGTKTPDWVSRLNRVGLDPFSGQPNDGIIPVSSDSESILPGPTLPFDLSHTEIECDPKVIEEISRLTNPPVDAFLGVGKGPDDTGTGIVTSKPAGIKCGDDCSEIYPIDTPVLLTAEKENGSTFEGWSGACTGTEKTCSLVMDSDKATTAFFKAEETTTFTLFVSLALDPGSSGKVISSQKIINCPKKACTVPFASNTVVELTAEKDDGSTFEGWSGACTGTNETCIITMDADKEVQASFTVEEEPAPTPTPTPSDTNTITCENDLEIATGPAATCGCNDLQPILVNGIFVFQPVLSCSVDTPESEITRTPK